MILDEQFDADEVLRDLDEQLDDDPVIDDVHEIDFNNHQAHQESFRDLSADLDESEWE